MITKHYGTISEGFARQAKQAYSFFDYVEGSATAHYRDSVDECFRIACLAAEKKPKEEERIQRLFDRYAFGLAENINAENKNTASCPSIMIAGGSNFPVHKKQKQNARSDALMMKRNYIESIPDKIRSIALNNTIYSDEEDAIEQLEEKAEKCRKCLESMKEQNAWYRKHGTMNGYGNLTDEEAERLDQSIKKDVLWDKPFPDFELTSVRTKMKNALDRAEKLRAAKANESKEITGDNYRVVENTDTMRIQIFFDGKPDQTIISSLKENGFRWAPSCKSWQRQLTDNGRRATKRIVEIIEKM